MNPDFSSTKMMTKTGFEISRDHIFHNSTNASLSYTIWCYSQNSGYNDTLYSVEPMSLASWLPYMKPHPEEH